jgi:glycosyltransferase involved in cell wall biosynthesis
MSPRIAHFVSFGVGGADRSSLELLKQIKYLHNDIFFVYSKNSFPRKTTDSDPKQQVLSIFEEFKAVSDGIMIEDVNQLNALELDILHTHRSGNDHWLIPGLQSIKRRFKIVETNFHGKLETPADFRIFPSRSLMKFNSIVNTRYTKVLPNIVNHKSGWSLRQELGFQDDHIILGRIARSDTSIYSENLLKVLARIQDPKVRVLWVGKSELAVRDADKFGVRNIMWLNQISDSQELANIYATLDLYVHANLLGETFGNTIAESLLRGIPVVSLRGIRQYPQAQREMLDKHQYARNQFEFAYKIRKLIENEGLRNQISKRNRNFAEEYFNPRSIALEVMRIYDFIIHGGNA